MPYIFFGVDDACLNMFSPVDRGFTTFPHVLPDEKFWAGSAHLKVRIRPLWAGICLARSSRWSSSQKRLLTMSRPTNQIDLLPFTGLYQLSSPRHNHQIWLFPNFPGPEQTALSPTAAQVVEQPPPLRLWNIWLSYFFVICLSGLTEAVGSTFYITKDGFLDLPVILKVCQCDDQYDDDEDDDDLDSLVISLSLLHRVFTTSAWLRRPALRECLRWF